MSNIIDTSKKYRATTVATIYEPYKDSHGNQYMKACGTMPGSAYMYLSGESIKTGRMGAADGTLTEFVSIDANNAPAYVPYSDTSITQTATGKYIALNYVALQENNGKGVATARDYTGHTNVISDIEYVDNRETYTVKTGYNWVTYAGPSSEDYASAKVYPTGKNITIYATWTDDNGNVWGCPSATMDRWGLLKDNSNRLTPALAFGNVTTMSTYDPTQKYYNDATVDKYGSMSNATNTVVTSMQTVVNQMTSTANKLFGSGASDAENLANMQYAIGIPPKITPTADPRYMINSGSLDSSNSFGRTYTDMFMMGNTVFAIQPCKVKYLPGIKDDEKSAFLENFAAAGMGGSADADLLQGQLFEAQPDYGTYINSVNAIARAMAIYMGIGDKPYKGIGSVPYKYMDYSWYKTKEAGKSRSIAWGAGYGDEEPRASAGEMIKSLFNDDTYINFYMTADGTSVNENMRVSTKSSGLESLFNNQLAELAKEIEFLGVGESSIGNMANGVFEGITNALGSSDAGASLANLIRYGGNYLKGGRMVFPQMLDDCTFDRSYTGTCRFISPSGDPEAIFLNCYLPIAYLLPFVLPQMLSDNMYRYPHLARVSAKGLYHCDLAAITNLKINRGGQDGTCWTADGFPFEVDVSFDVTPLYSKLMVTGTNHPILFMANQALNEYLGAMCGISFATNSLKTKGLITKALMGGAIRDVFPSMLRSVYGSDLANWARKAFNFAT